MRHSATFVTVCALGVLVMTGMVQASSSWVFAQDTLAARAVFETEGTLLKITLANTSTHPVVRPEEVLTGLVFRMPGVTLDPVRVVLADGSQVLFPKASGAVDSNGEIGGEYGYKPNLTGVFSTPSHVLSAVGTLVGASDVFPGANLDGPGSPNGIGYGLVSYTNSSSNAAVSGSVPLVSNSALFVLDGLPQGYDLSGICEVAFNYTSGLRVYSGTFEEQPPVVPEPVSALAVLLGLPALGGYLRRRRDLQPAAA